MIIGFGHRSRVGKDTAAGFLTGLIRQSKRNVLVVKTSFAAKLKAMCYDLWAWDGLREAAFYETEHGAKLRDVPLPTIKKTPVELWIEFGTTVGRACYYDTWVKYPLNQKHDYLIITDVRFENEVKAIQAQGGKVYKVVNNSAPIRDSVADNALNNFEGWDGILFNDNDLKTFNDLIVETFKGQI